MDKLTINLNNKPIYDIVYENSWDNLATRLEELGYSGKKLCIVSDSNVASLYKDAIFGSLQSLNSEITIFTFPYGEENKHLNTVNELYRHLIENGFTRKDCLLALGGGVTGDLTGFAAATYLRGIDFVQIPTSLLAMVDSSIGGKTGVDFEAYKNMVGAFKMPKLVYMNFRVLDTLDERQYIAGLGEVVKYGYAFDKEFINYIKENLALIDKKEDSVISYMIKKSCLHKKIIVDKDPYEKAERALLNYGHTLGHAIEKYMDFKMLHGECVFAGMLLVNIIAKNRDYISAKEFEESVKLISHFYKPELPKDIDIDEIINITSHDKKATNKSVRYILLKNIGDAYIEEDVAEIEVRAAFDEMLAM